jgi:tenascin
MIMLLMTLKIHCQMVPKYIHQCNVNNGTCKCDRLFEGLGCESSWCLNNCNNQGKCLSGTCICYTGWRGADCSIKTCKNDCSGRGVCRRGKWWALYVLELRLVTNIYLFFYFYFLQSVCDTNHAGEDCALPRCTEDCHNRGNCLNGECYCKR